MSYVCGAEREIKVEFTPSGDGAPNVFIVASGEDEFSTFGSTHSLAIGHSYDYPKSLIENCQRCIGMATRGCDLNWRNQSDLNPQIESK